MSKYTTETRFICEQAAGYPESAGYERIDDVLDKSWDKIFNTAVQIFDEEYRPIICKKILKHYYTQEIGCETVGLWKLWMNRTFEEKIVYYNQLYKSALLEFPVFQNVDYKMQSNKQGVGTTHNETVGNEQFQETQKWSGQDIVNKTGDQLTNTVQDTTEDSIKNTEQDSVKDTVQDTTKHTDQESVKDTTQDSVKDTVTDTTKDTTQDSTKDTTGNVKDVTTESIDITKTTDKTERAAESGSTVTTGTENETDDIDTHTEDTRYRGESSSDLKWNKYSDTPQGAVTGIQGTEDEDYWLTNATKDTDAYSGSSNENGNENGGSKETDVTTMNETVNHGKVVTTTTDMTEKTGQSNNKNETKDSVENEVGNVTGNEIGNSTTNEKGNVTTNETGSVITDETGNVTTNEVGNVTTDEKGNVTGNLVQDVKTDWDEEDVTTYGKQIDTNSNKDTTGTADGKSETTEDYIQHQFGKWGYQTYAEMLQKFRDTFLNIDLMFISEFEENFMQLW